MSVVSNDWQRVVEHLASYPGSESMSDNYLSQHCQVGIKAVRTVKKQLTNEKRGQITLLGSIREEIARLQSIPRCPLCSNPLVGGGTCEISAYGGEHFDHSETVHTACYQGYIDEMRWKINLLHSITSNRQPWPGR